MKELIFDDDKYKMNWIEGAVEWGTVKAPEGIKVVTEREKVSEGIVERYIFTNATKWDIFTSLEDISVYTPFNDDYTISRECVERRCHTHIWCGENITYVMALRMGGEPPHLGLVLTDGSIGGYSVERDLARISNDRGDFILHPAPTALAPGESFKIEWLLFRHEGKADFYKKLSVLCPRYISVRAEEYVIFKGEKIKIEIIPSFKFIGEEVVIQRNGRKIGFEIKEGIISVNENADAEGEYVYEISVNRIKTHCTVLVHIPLEELAYKRCRFIAEKQQYNNPHSRLDGAFLIYDNEEKHCYYNHTNDSNGARERVCMGILLAKYLRGHEDKSLKRSLDKYTEYLMREIYDSETGMVYNDCGRNNDFFRLYNFPWMSVFFLERFDLYHKKSDLENAYKIIKSFYKNGGEGFYAIELPIARIIRALNDMDMEGEKEELMKLFSVHCDKLLEYGINYPPHEVNYEQSIVAPAANILLQMYEITGEKRYFDGAKTQMGVLELFNGLQPDYHMHEVAIRHWDGYWFGKNRMYGDTYPHYWSALTANAYKAYGRITNDVSYAKKAESAYRAVLSLIHSDGTASCAYVYPTTVNGSKAHCFEPYANDQDWALYFMLRHRTE